MGALLFESGGNILTSAEIVVPSALMETVAQPSKETLLIPTGREVMPDVPPIAAAHATQPGAYRTSSFRLCSLYRLSIYTSPVTGWPFRVQPSGRISLCACCCVADCRPEISLK